MRVPALLSRPVRRDERLAFALVLLGTFVLPSALILHRERSVAAETAGRAAEASAQLLSLGAAPAAARGDRQAVESLLNQSRQAYPELAYAAVERADGSVRLASPPGAPPAGLVYAATPLVWRDGARGRLRVGARAKPWRDCVRPALPAIGLVALLSLIFTLIAFELRTTTRELAKMEFLSILCHELRTPMTTIHGFLMTIRERGDQISPDKRQEYLDIMQDESTRLVRFINNLLDITRIELGHYELIRAPGDLTQLVRAAIEASSVRRGDVHIVAYGCDRPLHMPLDVAKMRQALTTLIGNAAENAPKGSKVTVTVTPDARQVEVRVRDEGAGYARPYLDKLFDNSYRTGAAARAWPQSMGLSFSIARNIIELHGGDLRIASRLGDGNEFVLRIPLPRAAALRE